MRGRIVAIVVVATLLAVILGAALFTQKVDAGEACVTTRGGKITGVATPGYNFKTPIDKYHCYNTRLQSYETVADPKNTDSKATYRDYLVRGKSNEGIEYEVSFIIQYHVLPECARELYDNKARNDATINEQIVKLHARAVVPQILNTHSADTLYLGNLKSLSGEVAAELGPRYDESCVVLDYFELKKPNLADAYENAITDKALKVEQTKQKVLEQEYAAAEAERVRIEAEGVAAARVIEAQAQADSVVLAAEAEAEALDVRGAALDANPSTLTWEQIQAIRSADVIYLPADGGVLPIMDITVPEEEDKG